MSVANPHFHGENPAAAHGIKLRQWASIASIAVASVLIAAKFVAYMVTDSVSVMTSLMDSAFDAMASAITLFSVIHAATPADEEHRFGHGKAEALAAMGQALFIFGSAGYLFFEAAHRFLHPAPIKDIHIGIIVMAFSVILTGVLLVFQRHVIQRTQSVAISADNLHYKGDLLVNLSVMAALGLSYYSPWPYFDPLFAAAIAAALLYGAWQISGESFGILMDKELPDADRGAIEKLIMTHPAVRAVHDLRTRNSGQHTFIEFHLELDGALSLSEAHAITEEVETEIYKAFPKSEVLIHPEPAGLDDHRLDHRLKG